MIEYGPPPIAQRHRGQTSARWGEDLIALLPRSQREGEVCLEFGCGDGQARHLIEEYGYRWVGIDMTGDGMAVRCDGHRLPFADESFSLVVSVAVFEHLYDPFAAAREVARVLKPGGIFLGTTAFLEPFHANSYFHMSHMGVQRVLCGAGLEPNRLWATWNFLEATTTFWLPDQIPVYPALAKLARWVGKGNLRARTQALRWLLTARRVDARKIDERIQLEQLTWTGAIGFSACKPGLRTSR
jgi:SAM-dependent methyltransferase